MSYKTYLKFQVGVTCKKPKALPSLDKRIQVIATSMNSSYRRRHTNIKENYGLDMTTAYPNKRLDKTHSKKHAPIFQHP